MTHIPGAAATRSLLLLLTIASTAYAQRARVFGRAVRLDNTAWTNATVTLTARPIPEYWHAGKPDTIRVACNDRGRFEARILTFRTYSAWAHERLEDGRHRLSRIAEGIAPGRPVRLVEREARQLPLRLRVELPGDTGPWKEFSYQLLSRSPRSAFVVPLEVDDRGQTVVPPVPGSWVLFELLGPERQRLWQTMFLLTAEGRARYRRERPGAAVDKNDPELVVIRPPKPTTVAVRVVSGQEGRGVAGAVICAGPQDSSGSASDVHDSIEVARTDEKGHAQVPLFLQFDANGKLLYPRPSVRVWGEGLGEAVFRTMNNIEPNPADPKVVITLARQGHAVRGRILHDAKTPAANLPLLVYQKGHFISSKPWVMSTDARGEFRIGGRWCDAPYRITALVPTGDEGFADECYLAFVPPRHGDTTDHVVGTLRLDQLTTVEVKVRRDSGEPSPQAWVHVGETIGAVPSTMPAWRTDRAGNARLRVRSGGNLAVFAGDPTGFAFARLDVNEPKLDLKLSAAHFVEGRVTDPAGRPIEGALVLANCYQHERSGAWHLSFLDAVCKTSRALHHRRIYTDAEGRYRVPFPVGASTANLRCWKTLPDGTELSVRERIVPLKLTDPAHGGFDFVLAPRK